MQHKFSYTGTPIRFCNIDVIFVIVFILNVVDVRSVIVFILNVVDVRFVIVFILNVVNVLICNCINIEYS